VTSRSALHGREAKKLPHRHEWLLVGLKEFRRFRAGWEVMELRRCATCRARSRRHFRTGRLREVYHP